MHTPFNHFNNIVVTTDRCRLTSAASYQSFDCRSCCCWNFPYYGLKRAFLGERDLQEREAFLNFTHLQAFSTEYALEPPICAVDFPWFNKLCETLTYCASCGSRPDPSQGPLTESCYGEATCLPKRVQLWVVFLQKYHNEMQPHLMLSVRPYRVIQVAEDEEDRLDRSRGGYALLRSIRAEGKRIEADIVKDTDLEAVENLRDLVDRVLNREDKHHKEEENRAAQGA